MLKLGVEAVKEVLMRRRHLGKGMKEVSHVAIWEENAPGRKNSQCKGPEVGVLPIVFEDH